MNIAYVTKAHWGDNSPGLIFSYYQARSIADNNHEISLIMQPSKRPDDNKNDLNKINPIDLKLLSNSLGPFKANEIFYRRANALILSGDYDTVLTRDPGYLPYLVRLKEREKKIYYQSHNFYMDFSRHEYIQSVNRKKFNKYEMTINYGFGTGKIGSDYHNYDDTTGPSMSPYINVFKHTIF